ncbi:Mur ligase, partial [Tribonema minus]
FTSPHLHTVRERIRLGAELIPRSDLARITASLVPGFQAEPWMIFFDRLLAVALTWFQERGAELVILEAGVGGRYDPTNIILPPALCIVTNISLDHEGMLGGTIEASGRAPSAVVRR